jgi:UDP-3-O-[3-hydroxymyristoyl] glucosamine N-acyltransferase
VKIGRGTVIHPQAYIDDDVEIGENCVLYPRVTLFRRVRLGRKVVVHTGAVIGDDGFGYNQIPDPDRGRLHHLKNVHVGGVVIEDFVEIGAQTTIDAGMVEPTRIGAGTKIDNQVQIAHNVSTGRDCIILAQVGVSGSCRLGDRVFLLGQAGLVDGASIGDDAIVLGKAGVTRDLPAGRKAWAGRPPHPADQEWKVKALARKELPRLRDFWRALKSADSIEELKNRFFGPDDRGDR